MKIVLSRTWLKQLKSSLIWDYFVSTYVYDEVMDIDPEVDRSMDLIPDTVVAQMENMK